MDPAAVFCLDHPSAAKAAGLVGDFELPLFEVSGIAAKSSKERLRFFQDHLGHLPALAFLVSEDVVQLALIDDREVLAIRARFHGSGVDYRRAKGGSRSEIIARAVGLKGQKVPRVVDATAGLGVDAFVLASLGCRVTMLERVPAVSALLRDGLERSLLHASGNDPALEAILRRMQLVRTDAVEYFNRMAEADSPDVVYLDPMFPERRKSAAVKKEMQLFHKLIGPDKDADRLFQVALSRARDRVVVKRPRIAPSLAGREPSHRIEGKRNRYDVYLIASL
jgi:16S rRNA (guanine1516-N2)-methyltransferase